MNKEGRNKREDINAQGRKFNLWKQLFFWEEQNELENHRGAKQAASDEVTGSKWHKRFNSNVENAKK